MNPNKKSFIQPIFLIILVFIEFQSILAQEEKNGPQVFLSPRITLGYTFGSGLNYGFDIMLGLYKMNDFKFGMNFTYYMANTDQGHHRIKGFGVVGETDYFSVKLGAGSVSRRWGLKNVNKASAPGLMVDVAAGFDPYRAPWLGIKSFIYSREKWQFYDQPSYISVYTYFKSNEIKIFEEDSETETNQ